jgi:UDP-glucose 4-epimerase
MSDRPEDRTPTLVTGGSGYVGSAVVRALAWRGPVTVVARRPVAAGDHILASLEYDLRLPLADLPALRGAAVVHCAAEIRSPHWADHWRGNVVATHHVLEWAVRHRSPRVIFLSTGGVYGFRPGRRMVESDAIAPDGHYARTKAMAEQLALRAAARHGLPVVIFRLYFPFGGTPAFGIFRRALTAAQEGASFGVRSDGGPRMTPVHVDDAADAVVAGLGETFAPGVYNLCGNEDLDVLDLIRRLESRTGHAVDRQAVIDGTGDMMGDNTALCRAGWSPRRSLDEYLDRCT